MTRILAIAVLIVAQAIPATAQSRDKSLDHWLDHKLIPYVRQQLKTHPRFRDETVMFVVLEDNAPAAASNALALSLRDRILEATVDTAGVSVGWQQAQGDSLARPTPADCIDADVHYYIGIDLTQELDGSYVFNLRALDREDRTWVAGFGQRWQGRLTTAERQALRQRRDDLSFLGARDVPFTTAQTDLLAAYLARHLSCELQREVAAQYVVTAWDDSGQPTLQGTAELVGNNLASSRALRLAGNAADGNAVLNAKAHPVDGALHQYWLTVTPTSDAGDLPTLSASAYVLLPGTARVAGDPGSQRPAAAGTTPAVLRHSVSIPNAGDDALIRALEISAPAAVADCQWPCSMLTTRASTDAALFFLQHQASHGLVRLGDDDCRQRTQPRIARAGDVIRFPISRTSTVRSDWSAINDWPVETTSNTYFAVVVSDVRVARRIANLMDRLPQRCTDSLRPGLADAALRDWLTEFAAIAADASTAIDWRAIQVRDVT